MNKFTKLVLSMLVSNKKISYDKTGTNKKGKIQNT